MLFGLLSFLVIVISDLSSSFFFLILFYVLYDERFWWVKLLTCVGWCWRIRFWSLLGLWRHRNRLLLVPCITLLLRLLRLVRRSSMKPRYGWNHGWTPKNFKSLSLLVLHHHLPLLTLVSKRVWHFLNQAFVNFIGLRTVLFGIFINYFYILLKLMLYLQGKCDNYIGNLDPHI